MSGIPDEEKAAAGIMKDQFGTATKTVLKKQGMAVVNGDEYVQHDAPTRRAHVCW